MDAVERLENFGRWISGTPRSDLKVKTMKRFIAWWYCAADAEAFFERLRKANDDTTLGELRG